MKTPPAPASSFAAYSLRRSRRGSLLIVAMLFSAAIAVSLASFLRLSTSTTQLSYRSFYAGAAMNAAETGLEYGMWSVNKQLAGSSTAAWNGWGPSSSSSSPAQRTFDLGSLSGGATAQVKVYINKRNLAGEPYILARSIITPLRGPTLEKWIKVTLKKRSRFTNGLVAKDTISFKGTNASVDSWDSDPDANASTAAIAYSTAVRKDNGSVGSIVIENPSVFTNNADIWGSASTGGYDPTEDVGKNGSILGADSAAKDTSSWLKINVDPDRIATDFTADFKEVETPSGDVITSVGASLGTTGGTASYTYSGKINKNLLIEGNVTLILTGSGNVIDLTGSDGITLAANATLTIYTAGNIKLAGNGLLNPNDQPKAVMIYGTATDSDGDPTTTHQEIDIAGNGDLKAVVYAPNASTTINGNGNVMGSIVSGDITLTGNAAFHYDESLARLDTGEPLGMDEWNEFITYEDRHANASLMNF